MKYIILLFCSLFLFTACQQNEEPVIYQETGVVVNYAGADHCSVVIELDNGQKILPLYHPEDFVFYQGQRLLLNYLELPNIMSTCGRGIASEIIHVEELSCGSPLTEIEMHEYNSLPNDPVFIHEAYLDGDCLNLKVSFSGGCRNHAFDLARIIDDQQKNESALLELRHDANGDLCEAALSMELRFNVSDLKEQGYKQFIFEATLNNGETFRELFKFEE